MTPVDLVPLLKPRSVAIFGASERPSIGRSLIRSLRHLGYDGGILPINPKYQTLLDLPCYGGLDALPSAPDVVVFCTSQSRTQDAFRRLPDCGARAAVIYGGGYGEAGEEGRRLQDELAGICADAGIALMGPNCMGGVSPWERSATYMSEICNARGLQGNVGFVSQSGSVSIGMMIDVRRFGFSHVISSGKEAVVTTADYLDFLIDDPKTKVIGAFIETVNNPECFVSALDRASDAGKPVVVLKVGRSERAQRSITSHTGGLAGRTEVLSEVLRAHRAIEVRSLEEMTEVLAVCQGTAWPKGPRISVLTASGGHAELILDTADAAGVSLPPLAESARAEIETVTGRLTGDGNPTDAWGRGDFNTNIEHTLNVLQGAGAYDAFVVCLDAHDGDLMDKTIPDDVAGTVAASGQRSGLPHYLLNTRPGLMTTRQQEILSAAGQTQISGIGPGLAAIDRMACWSTWQRRPRPPVTRDGSLAQQLWQGARTTINEFDAKAMLATYGLPAVAERTATTLEEVLTAAGELGYPVVLKALGDDIPHKSDLGLVAVNLTNEDALREAWQGLLARRDQLPTPDVVQGFVVQEMIADGIEVFAGVTRDPDFGLTLAFGIGGIAVEVLQDFSLRPLPLGDGEAETMVEEIRGRALLGSLRGGPPADVESLVRCLYGLSDFAAAHKTLIEEIDLNPIKVLPQGHGSVIVDALIVGRPTTDD